MTTLTVAELATRLDTDPRTTRKFLRSITEKDAQPGKGARWVIEAREVRSLTSKFTKFIAAAQAPQVDDKSDDALDAPEVDDDTLEPTDDELDEIEMA